MLRSRATLLISASALALAACDDTTAPREGARPGETPEAALLINFGYSATVLPIIPADINDSGVILGNMGENIVRYRSNGSWLPYKRLAGVGGVYVAKAINRAGAATGEVQGGRGLFWRHWAQIPYSILSPSGGEVLPLAVSNNNVVVGSFRHLPREGGSETHAFRWSPSVGFIDITPPGYTFAIARDVNDAGWVVGYGALPGGHVQALRWAPDPGWHASATVLGEFSTARVVSANGGAIGTSDEFSTMKSWPVTGGTYPLAGPQESSPDDMSSLGRVVGYTYGYSAINPHRPWTTFNGTTTWLPVPDVAATDNVLDLHVNSCGTIIGTQVFTGGAMRGLMWSKPYTCDLAGIGGGIGGIGGGVLKR